MKRLAAAIFAILTTAVICYGVESLSIQQMFQSSPKETSPQGATRVLTVRGGVVRQMSYSSVHPLATSSAPGAVKPDGTTTTVDSDGTLHGTAYPNPGIPYSLGNGWGIPFTPSNKIPSNYVALPVVPATKAPCGNGYHLDSYDATTGQFTCSADASVGGASDPNAIHVNAAGEIAGVSAKATPAGADLILIESAADGNVKRSIRADALPYQPQGSYLQSSAVGSTVQAHSAALDAVTGTNTGDETQASIKSKLGAAGPGDGYMTAAQYVTLSNALQPGASTTGNAGTATKLATPRAINGVAFDGSAPITINAVDSTPRLAATAQAVDSAKLAGATPSANALTLITHSFSQMVSDLSTALNAAYHGLTIVGSEITTALGFTPENVANKSNDATMAANSSTLYPTQAAVRTYVANNGGGGSSALFKVYTSGSWQNKTGYVWYRGTGDPDPSSSMGPYDILNDATAAAETYADTLGLWSGTKDATHCLAGDGTMQPCAGGSAGVTSVGITPPSFLTVSGSPVTGSGNITLGLAAGSYIPTSGDKTYWDGKQAALSAGSNIKTVAGISPMGSGELFASPMGASYGGTGVTDHAFSGTQHKVASVGFVNPASNKCVEVDASGNLQIAGSNAACGSGGSGLSTSLTAGHVYVGNAGGTATDTAISGDGTLSSTGALTVTKSGGVSFGSNAFNSTAFLTAASTLDATKLSGTAAVNTTGSAAKWTTARNLAGNSTDGSANVPFANKFIVQGTTDAGLSGAQFLGALGTGLVKNTTTTGVLSIAAAGTDYQQPLSLLPGTYTNGNLCTYTSAGTLLNCNTPTSTFQAAGTYVTAVTASNSLASSGGTTPAITLSGDTASPGNSMLYGTNASGVKGWYAQPSGVGGTNATTIQSYAVDSAAPSDGDVWQYSTTSTKWLHVTPATLKASLSLAKADVGLGSVENTALSTWGGSANITTTGTVTTGTWSGGFGAVSGANLTGLTAGNLSGTIPSAVLGNSTLYLGTTGIALNRGSGALALTGVTSIDGYAAGLAGGNGTTLLGSIPYQSGSNVTTMLAPNTTSTKKFLSQTGTGTNGAAPVWGTVVKADISDLTLPTGAVVGTTDTQTLTGKQEAITGSGLTAGSVYYMGATGLALAKADSASTLPAICIAVSATQCAYSGVYTTGSWTQGQKLYVSDNTAGALTSTAPSTTGHFVQAFGVAATSGSVLALPSVDVGGL